MQCLVESYDDYSDCKCISQKLVRALKPHKCGECRQMIAPGQFYEHYTGIDWGRMHHEKTCSVCVELRDKYVCGGYTFGTVLDMIYEELQEREDLDLGCLDGLSPAALDKMIGIMDRAWSEDHP